ncbi:MAG: transglycosylase SLT domain-containing protein [Reyranellaceae bacterium]
MSRNNAHAVNRRSLIAVSLLGALAGCARSAPPTAAQPPVPPKTVYNPGDVDPDLAAKIQFHADENNVPVELVHKVIRRESRYQPRVIGGGYAMGLMQIKYSTARGMGYAGNSQGLLDPDTNLYWGVRYLAAAYRYAGGDPVMADRYYARGFPYRPE